MSMPARAHLPAPEPAPQLAAVIQRHQAFVWRYLRFLGCDAALADDLTQDTFVAVLGRHAAIPSRSLRSYLRRTAYSLFLKSRRRAKRQVALVDPEVADAAAGFFHAYDDGAGFLEALEICLATLDDRENQVVRWRYAERARRTEIGRRLDLKESGVKSLLSRIHHRLRECVTRRLSS